MNQYEPGRNVYIGHRYVPLLMGEWDKSIAYEGLSIVTYKGASYTSKKRVPVGIDIENEEFWVLTGNYNAQIEYYRDDVNSYRDEVYGFKEDAEQKISDVRTYVDDETSSARQYVDDETSSARQYVDDETSSARQYVDDETSSTRQYVDDETSSARQYVDDEVIELNRYVNDGLSRTAKIINVKEMFDAIGDKIADDTQSIQNAIDSANDGEIVYLPQGDYLITDSIQFRRETKLIGENAFIHYDGDGIALKVEKYADFQINPYIEDIHVRSVNYNQTGVGMSVKGSTENGKFVNCSFFGFEKGVDHSSDQDGMRSWFSTFVSCRFRDNIHGIYLNGESNATTIEDCKFRYNEYAVYIKDSTNVRVVGCGLEHNSRKDDRGAIYLDNAFSTVIDGNYFESNGNNGDIPSPVIMVSGYTVGTRIINNYLNGGVNHSVIHVGSEARGLYIEGNYYNTNASATYDIDISEMTSLAWVHIDGNRGSGFDKLNMPDITSHTTTWVRHGTALEMNTLMLRGSSPSFHLYDKNTDKETRLQTSNDIFRVRNNNGETIFEVDGSNNQVNMAIRASTTANRPSNPRLGECYWDSTLQQPIWWNGAKWKDASGLEV